MDRQDMTGIDVAIIGGAIMGSCTAYFLKQLDPALRVAVIERDPTFEFASTLKASGGARRLFSCPENIAMSNFGIDFIEHFGERMMVEGEEPAIDWRPNGYLFIVPPNSMHVLEDNAVAQRQQGVQVLLLSPQDLKSRYPSMHVGDLGGAALSPKDGWCDPNSMLQGVRRKARSLGVSFIKDRVVALEHDDVAVRSAKLESGAIVQAEHFVNAAGAWAAQIGDMAGMKLPITPLPREEYYFTCETKVEPLPFVKDLSRLAFRPEGLGYSGGLVNGDAPRGFRFDVDYDYFDNVMWPALAHRFPAMEAVKLQRAWTGLYEQCELDGNPIIGRWDRGLKNFHVVAGFSGHGLMHAPAAGRAIAELIVQGSYQTIDLTRLGYGRVADAAPYRERGIL
jgi:FAD-dependent oxidoreductase domain-containing protein 1